MKYRAEARINRMVADINLLSKLASSLFRIKKNFEEKSGQIFPYAIGLMQNTTPANSAEWLRSQTQAVSTACKQAGSYSVRKSRGVMIKQKREDMKQSKGGKRPSGSEIIKSIAAPMVQRVVEETARSDKKNATAAASYQEEDSDWKWSTAGNQATSSWGRSGVAEWRIYTSKKPKQG